MSESLLRNSPLRWTGGLEQEPAFELNLSERTIFRRYARVKDRICLLFQRKPHRLRTMLHGFRIRRTPEEFLAFAEAKTSDPKTGQPDLAQLKAFAASHPNAAQVLRLLQSQPALVSFAQVSYRPLHTFMFVNADGDGRWADSNRRPWSYES